MKFFKTIRFDPSDTHVYEQAADPDQWAVPGGFLFAADREGDFTGKRKQSFANGFFAVADHGHSTFVSVAELSAGQCEQMTRALAGFFIDHMGAPSIDDAMVAANDEVAFVMDLCADLPQNSVMAVTRYFDEQGGIREEFRMVDAPGAKPHARVWEVVED